MNRSVAISVIASSAALAVLLTTFSGVLAQTPSQLRTLALVQPAYGAAPARQNTSPLPTPTAVPTPVDTSIPIGLISPTVGASAADELSATPGSTSTVVQSDLPVTGTILANRTDNTARFFLEGEVTVLEPRRSIGFQLPRVSAVLNLYTCDASAPETQSGCYWDPYLLERDGFYEIHDISQVKGLPSLMLRVADTPPANQIWMQNRTGNAETVVFKDTQYKVEPGAVEQFEAPSGAPAIVYVRSCLTLDDDTVCEWSPISLDTGGYFAMIDIATPGGVPGSEISTIDLRPVVDAAGEAPAPAAEIACALQVPALNVRSGPGLQYEIIGKVREAANEPGRVVIVGRSADRQWFSVANSVAPGGWITSSPNFILCTGKVEDLPITEFSGGALAATPVPAELVQAPEPSGGDNSAVATPAPDTAGAPAEEAAATPETSTQSGAEIPEGLALLFVNNGFQYDMRFTIDQQYRPAEGPSEYDLRPGESVSIVVFPGTIAFTASSPWNGLSGNSNLEVAGDQSVTLWLRFEPDAGSNSGQWNLAWN